MKSQKDSVSSGKTSDDTGTLQDVIGGGLSVASTAEQPNDGAARTAESVRLQVPETESFPIVVCLCGSTKFKDAFEAASRREGLAGRAGRIVLSVSCFGHDGDLPPEACIDGHPTKQALDSLHFRKIELADEVLILNVGGYIGSSTRRELDYARQLGKRVRFLEAAQ